MKQCIAMSRDITTPECRKAQRALPIKFCEGCTWLKNIYILKNKSLKSEKIKVKDREVKIERVKPRTYKVPIPAYLREHLLRIAERRGTSVNQVIVNLLSEAV